MKTVHLDVLQEHKVLEEQVLVYARVACLVCYVHARACLWMHVILWICSYCESIC